MLGEVGKLILNGMLTFELCKHLCILFALGMEQI